MPGGGNANGGSVLVSGGTDPRVKLAVSLTWLWFDFYAIGQVWGF